MASIYNIRINLDTSDVSGKAGKAKQGISEIGKEAERTNKILRQMRTFVAGYFTFTGISAVAKNLKQTADAYTELTNKIKTVSSETENLTVTTERLFAIAQRTRTEISGTAQLYQRLKIAQKSLGATSEEIMRFTEGIGKAMVVSGASVGTQRAVLLQLSQAMGQTNLRAEEFNSIQEGGLYILQAAANGMSRFGGNINALRQAVLAGEVTNKEFFEGVLNGLAQIDRDFSKTTPTIEQSVVILSNSWTKFVGELNKSIGVSNAISDALVFMAENLKLIGELAGIAAAGIALLYAPAVLNGLKALKLSMAFLNPYIAAVTAITAAAGLFASAWETSKIKVDKNIKTQVEDVKLINSELASMKIFTKEALDEYKKLSEQKVTGLVDDIISSRKKIEELKNSLNNINDDGISGGHGKRASINKEIQQEEVNLNALIEAYGRWKNVNSQVSTALVDKNWDKSKELQANSEAAKKAADSIKDLTFELSLFGKTEREIAQEKAAQKALGASPEDINRIKELTGRVYDLTKQEESLKKIKEDIKTPQEKYKDQLTEIDKLYKINTLSVDEYSRAVTKLNEEFANENMPKWQQALRDLYRETELLDTKTMSFTESGKEAIIDFAKTGFGTLEDTITDIATNGTNSLAQSFSDMTVSILSDLARIVIRATIVNNALTALGVGSSGLTGGGLLSFFGSLGGSTITATAGSSPNIIPMKADGGMISGPGTGTSDSIPALLSNGEFVMNASATRRFLPMLERMNNKYASGGLVGGGTSGGTTLIVNDNRNANDPPVQMERSKDSNGNETIRMYINKEIKRSANNGTLDKTLSSNYGLKRAGIRR